MGLSIMTNMKMPENIQEFFRKHGKIGAAKRTEKLSPERRREIAKKAADARWSTDSKKAGSKKQSKRTGGEK